MALQVWLPLNGNLNNQGLTNVTVTNSGTTVDNNGKIGKCYAFNGSSKITNTLPTPIDSNIGTLACWFKMTSLPSSSGFYNLMQLGNLGGYATCRFGVYMEYSNRINISIDGSDLNTNAYTHSLVANQWYHLCVTHDGTTVKLYIDGVEVLSKASTKGSYKTTASYLYVGGTSSWWLKGSMNDIRYYSTALSPKEIEILSRGLVAHYPLNGGGRGGDNLYTELYWKYSTTKWGYAAQVGTVKPVLNSDGSVTFTGGGGTNSQCYIHHISNRVAISSNTTYTVSCKITASGSGTFKIYLYQYDSSGAKVGNTITTIHNFADGETKTISNTITTTSTTASFYAELNMYGSPTTSTMLLHANSLKLEKGDKVTPWIPNSVDSAYSAIGYDSTTEYDVSGYGNNGTKNGTIAYLTDTPRYNVSTNIKSASSYIQIPNLTTTGFSNSYSFAWWGKVPSYQGYMMWGFSNGQRLNGIFNGNLWNTGDGASNPLYVPGTTTQVTVPTTKVWHHWVMTGDGTTCKVYQDGVLWGQAKTYKSISGTTIYINGWDSGTSYTYGDYQMSDFRIYSTALSAAQVAELYNTAVSVANNGTLMGYELVEV